MSNSGRGRGRGRGARPKENNLGYEAPRIAPHKNGASHRSSNFSSRDSNRQERNFSDSDAEHSPQYATHLSPEYSKTLHTPPHHRSGDAHSDSSSDLSPGSKQAPKKIYLGKDNSPDYALPLCRELYTSGSESPPETVVRRVRDGLDVSKLARRPGYGKVGKPIELLTNYFRMSFNNTEIFHYDVEINSLDELKKRGNAAKLRGMTAAEAAKANVSNLEHQLARNVGKAKCKEVIEELIRSKSLQKFNPVYDGNKNIYTSKPLGIKDKKVAIITLEMAGRKREYEVTVQPVENKSGSNMIEMKAINDLLKGRCDKIPQETLSALNTIMNHRESRSDQIQVGRSFFFLNQDNKFALGEGIEIWFGYNQSIHFTESGPALVLNLSAKAFHKAGPVLNYVTDVLNCDIRKFSQLTDFQINKLNTALKGLKVEVTHLRYPRRYVVLGISKMSAKALTFDMDNCKTSIADYFAQKYRPLKYPGLPCLYMRSSNKTYIPMENCVVCEGQPKLGKLSGAATAKMIKRTAVPPNERFRGIQRDAETVADMSGEQMNNFNLFMELKPMGVPARVIDPPALGYSERGMACPDEKGTWKMNRNKFFKSPKSNSWIMLSFCTEKDCPKNKLSAFADALTRNGKKAGLDFGSLLDVYIVKYNEDTKELLIRVKKSGASFAVIVLSKRDHNRSYEEIKFISDYHLGLVTQCMDVDCINRCIDRPDQVAGNVCLKINAKLGGVNHVLVKKPEIFSKPFMVLGADAVHSPRGSGCPSIAAVVGSLDSNPSRYKLSCRVQDNPDGNKMSQELIIELKPMVMTILKAFYHNTQGKYPEKLIFFRDGVSEGQFTTVFEHEVTKLQQACKEVIGRVVPITFIVVQKRHQTRFLPRDPKNSVGRGGNVPPGTIVDTGITHPRLFDYFLCSHEGIQGTSKPAKYTILHDDNNFGADEIQKLCYHLCHMYVRCNRSISIPAPVMYADLAAYRAKKYADWHIMEASSQGSSVSSDTSCKLPDHVRDAIQQMENFEASMFYV